MTLITSGIALALSTATFIVRPGLAFAILIASMLIWPDYLRIPVGPAWMSISRFVAFAIILKMLSSGRGKDFRFCALDGVIIADWLWIILSTLGAENNMSTIIRALGTGMDTALLYFAARLTIQNEQDFKDAIGLLSITAIYMAIIGIVENITNNSPYRSLIHYRPWETAFGEVPDEKRLGLYRARASSSIHIYFGLTMAMVFGIIVAGRGYISNFFSKTFGPIGGFFATFSSMSSGPWISLILFLFFSKFFNYSQYIKKAIMLSVLALLGLQIVMNRDIHYLVSYISLNAHTAWYRAKLIDVSIINLHEYWLFGYGANTPHHWGAMIDGRPLVDMVNHFVLRAATTGVLGFILFLTISVIAIRYIMAAWKKTTNIKYRKMVFTLGALLIGVNVAIWSVSMYGTPLKMYYILIALIVSVCSFNMQNDADEERPIKSDVGFDDIYTIKANTRI
jgi:hypothetical protein